MVRNLSLQYSLFYVEFFSYVSQTQLLYMFALLKGREVWKEEALDDLP